MYPKYVSEKENGNRLFIFQAFKGRNVVLLFYGIGIISMYIIKIN
jgi:hypothetical protein